MRNLKIFSSLYNGSIGFYGRLLCVTADNEEIKSNDSTILLVLQTYVKALIRAISYFCIRLLTNRMTL